MHQLENENENVISANGGYKQITIQHDPKEQVAPVAKRKQRNNQQQIIYVMPGPDQ